MTSSNFEMYTTAGERSARDTLRYFEQARSFFTQTMPNLQKESAVRIVAFSSVKEYEPYRFNDYATAYYHPTADRDYIVMSHTGAETFPTATHEYVHLIVRHAHLNFPPWLNEGLAELYSTFQPRGDKVLVGALIAGRYRALLQDRWVPLEIILTAGHDSAYYNEKDKAGSLYNEGWALTHMLALSPEYRPKFPQVMRSISNGTPSVSALETIYGKPIGKIQADLQGYLRGGKFQGVLVPAKLEKVEDDMKAEPAEDFAVKLVLAELGDRPGNEKAARAALEELAAQKPDRPELYLDLAYLDLRGRQMADAREHFGKAFDLGSRNPRMLWDYGRMAEGSEPSKAAQALGELLQQAPDRLEVRLELASVELNSHHAKDALETLAPVKKVTPEDAPRLLMLLTYANLATGDRATARRAADQWTKVAATPQEKQRASQMLQLIDEARADAAAPQLVDPDARPHLAHRDPPPQAIQSAAPRPSVTGKFVELRCGTPAMLVIETDHGPKMFQIEDPSKLVVNGTSQVMDLNCGPQKPAQVRIEYDPVDRNPASGADGIARVLHFNP